MAQSKLDIVVGSNVGKALSGIKSVTSALAGVTGKIAGIVGIGGGIAAGFGIPAAFAAATTSAIRFGEEMAKLKSTLGATVQDVGMLQFISKIDDVSLDTISAGMSNLQVNMEHIAEGSAPDLAAKLAGVGISLEKLKGLSITEQFMELSKVFQGISDNSTKLDISKAMFGKGPGAEMKNFLEKGPQYIQEMLDEATSANVYSENFAKLSDRLGDIVDKFILKLVGARSTIFEAIAGPMIEAGDVINSKDFVSIAQNIGTSLKPVVESLSNALLALTQPGGLDAVGNMIVAAFELGSSIVSDAIINALGKAVDGIAGKIGTRSKSDAARNALLGAVPLLGPLMNIGSGIRRIQNAGARAGAATVFTGGESAATTQKRAEFNAQQQVINKMADSAAGTERNTRPGYAPLPPPTPY